MASRTVMASRQLAKATSTLSRTVPRVSSNLRTFASSTLSYDQPQSTTPTAKSQERANSFSQHTSSSASQTSTLRSPNTPNSQPSAKAASGNMQKSAEEAQFFEVPQCLLPTQTHPFTHKNLVATLRFQAYTTQIESMDTFVDFARKAAFAIGIPAEDVAHLPTRVRLWTVPKSPFVHKKAQENFWRRTHAREIKLYDANDEVIDRWLLFLRIHAVPGVTMKAQLFRHHAPGVGTRMTQELESNRVQISERLASISTSAEARGQATTEQTGDKIKEIAENIVREEMEKVEIEASSTPKAE